MTSVTNYRNFASFNQTITLNTKVMKKLTIAAYAAQRIKENYRRYVSRWEEQNEEEQLSIAEWCELEAESDPDFYRWLFNFAEINDFGSDLTEEEKQIAFDFFNNNF